MSEENLIPVEAIANATEINDEHNWKDEVAGLLDQIEYLKQEVAANQLMVGLVLSKTGAITVTKQEIATGLSGHQIGLEDDGDKVTFSLEKINE